MFTGEDTHRCPYKDYNSLNMCNANWVLLSTFTFKTVTSHLRLGKKVSNLSSGDVNFGPIPSRRGLLEGNPYHAIWTACLSCN
jgi:hypothetical protein